MKLAWIALVGLLWSGDREDSVVLKDGKTLKGRVVFQDQTRLVLRRDARDTTLDLGTVERVDSRVRDLEGLLENAARKDQSDPRELELLVSQAEECGLEGESKVFWWRQLLLAHARGEENEDARRALGHVKRGRGWGIPVGSRTVDWDKRFEMARDWGGAWEFESLHYRLRTNLPLETTLDVLLDLERFYRVFQDVVGGELGLYDVCRPMSVNVHADKASYPENAGESGRYDTLVDTVDVDSSQRFAFETLAHECTHQLLYDTAFRERKADGTLPPWLDEGLAEYMAGGVTGLAPLVYEAGKPVARHFHAHASAKSPFDLKRILSFSVGDYLASSDRELKYAQSYTFVHFLMHAEGGRHRAGFFQFLRTVYDGKGSSTDLKRCLDTDWRPLEKAWHAYARGMGF